MFENIKYWFLTPKKIISIKLKYYLIMRNGNEMFHSELKYLITENCISTIFDDCFDLRDKVMGNINASKILKNCVNIFNNIKIQKAISFNDGYMLTKDIQGVKYKFANLEFEDVSYEEYKSL